MVRIARVIGVLALVVGCGSNTSSSSVTIDAADAAAERPADTSHGGQDATGDIDGDCTPATAFTCVASCTDPTPATLICDDGHWECERGVDPRQCADAGS